MNETSKDNLLDFISDHGLCEVLQVMINHCENHEKFWVEHAQRAEHKMYQKQFRYGKNRLQEVLAKMQEFGPGSGCK